MKNILKTLEADKEEIQTQFNQLAQRRQQLQEQLNLTVTEMARLEGEHRRIEKLLNDFKDEPQSKSGKEE